MFNAQSINKSNKQTAIGLILVILLAIFLSTFSTHSRSQEINVELGGGCETVVQFISMVPAFSLYRIGAYGAASVWAAASPYVAQGTSMDTIACSSIESFLESQIESANSIDVDKFIEENCNGMYGGCDDPLLDVNGCGMFHTCPQYPHDCEFNTLRCVDSMINMSDGFTILEMTNALTYIHSSYNQGYWHHKRANDNNITFDIK